MRTAVICWGAVLVSAAFAQAPVASSGRASQIGQLIAELDQTRLFTGVSISPDGQWITWTQPAGATGEQREIYLSRTSEGRDEIQRITAGVAGKRTRRLEAGGRVDSEPGQEEGVAWSPDSKQIAFLSDAGNSGQQQVFVKAVSGGTARRLTNLHGFVKDLRWSPDGKGIAFLYAEGGGGGGPLQAVAAQVGAINAEIHNQRLCVVSAPGGPMRQVSPAGLNIYEYDWAPDGKTWAAIAAPGPADNNWWIAKLYTIDAENGKMAALYQPPPEQQLAVPRFSPDGKQIAFIGGLMSDEGFNGGDVFLMPSGGGTARNLTENRKSTPNWIRWRDNSQLLMTETADGGGAISTLRTDTLEAERLWQGPNVLHDAGNYPNFSVAGDGKTSALIRSTWQDAPEIWAGPIGEWKRITNLNARAVRHWGKAESVTWDNDGFHVQGWLLYPDHFDAQKRYPMVVSVHGGPSNQHSAAWPDTHFDMSMMAGLGYFVFFPNPRGSYGQGEAFTRANVKDFGGGDLRDILTGVDAVVKKAPVDTARVGITGWSYGGYMTMWTVTQTNRFKAAVAGAGIANWLSYYGENSIDEWMIPFFGASVYDDPAVYAKSSPITFIKQVKTPTLVIVGERDGECPASQSFEFWHALNALHVATELVVYPGEGHAFSKRADNVDRMRRTLAWFDKYLSDSNLASQ